MDGRGFRFVLRLRGIPSLHASAVVLRDRAVAICGLPPLNGFVSELMIYLSAFTAVRSSEGVAAAPTIGSTPSSTGQASAEMIRAARRFVHAEAVALLLAAHAWSAGACWRRS